jgi:hypothetical protein
LGFERIVIFSRVEIQVQQERIEEIVGALKISLVDFLPVVPVIRTFSKSQSLLWLDVKVARVAEKLNSSKPSGSRSVQVQKFTGSDIGRHPELGAPHIAV